MRADVDLAPSRSHRSAELPAGVDRGFHALMLAAVVEGVAFRLVFFERNRPLWYDEASVAANVVHRTWGALFRPLSGTQTAPPLFLVLLKGIMRSRGAESARCASRQSFRESR